MANTVSPSISDETLSAMIQIESGGNVRAAAPTSSARGLGQFLNSTWISTVRKHKPAWANRRSDQELIALSTVSPCSRYNARCSVEMLARFTEDNAKALGPGWTDGDLYLAHFAGAGTARALLRANPDSPASSVFSAAAVQANQSILAGKTCGQVRKWAASRMKASAGRNWIAVYWKGAAPVTPPKEKAKAATAAAGAAGGAAATVQASSGWSATEWALFALGAALLVAGIVFAVRWWKKRNTVTRLEQTELAHGLV